MYLKYNKLSYIPISNYCHMKFYIIDRQVSTNPAIFNSLNETVSTLEKVVKYKFNLNRRQYMQNLIDLGYGADDPLGRTFTESMSEYVELGIVKDGKCMRCNIHEAAHYSKYVNEMGH